MGKKKQYKLANRSEKEVQTKYLLEHYSARHDWLKDSHFLKELEGDSVDTEILDEELNSIQEQQPKSCRGKTLQILESNPVQILLCVLVLIDAGVVIAEILMDLHAIRSQYIESQDMLKQAVHYLNHSYSDVIGGYGPDDMREILHALEQRYPMQSRPPQDKNKRHAKTDSTYQHQANRLNVLFEQTGSSDQSGYVSDSETIDSNINSRNSAEWNKLSDNTEVPEHILPGVAVHDILFRASRDTGENKSSTSQIKATKEPKYTYAEKLLKIAHILHYCSIAILGIFVVQFVIKMLCMGLAFFRDKLEMFDAVIISASFCLDVIFLDGSFDGATGDETAALLIVFLLWRLLRVVNGMMVTSKKRQEFRIKLQKRARRKAEKRAEILDDDKQFNQKEIHALKELCYEKGALDLEVASCRPRRRKAVFEKMNTSAGISSIAALSLGFSMSMSGAANATVIPHPPQRSPAFQIRSLVLGANSVPKSPPKRRTLLSVITRKSTSSVPSLDKSPQTSVEIVSPLELSDCQNSEAAKSQEIELLHMENHGSVSTHARDNSAGFMALDNKITAHTEDSGTALHEGDSCTAVNIGGMCSSLQDSYISVQTADSFTTGHTAASDDTRQSDDLCTILHIEDKSSMVHIGGGLSTADTESTCTDVHKNTESKCTDVQKNTEMNCSTVHANTESKCTDVHKNTSQSTQMHADIESKSNALHNNLEDALDTNLKGKSYAVHDNTEKCAAPHRGGKGASLDMSSESECIAVDRDTERQCAATHQSTAADRKCTCASVKNKWASLRKTKSQSQYQNTPNSQSNQRTPNAINSKHQILTHSKRNPSKHSGIKCKLPCIPYRGSYPSDGRTDRGRSTTTTLCANKRFLFANRSYPSIGKRRHLQHEPVRLTESDNSTLTENRQTNRETLLTTSSLDKSDADKNGHYHTIVQMTDQTGNNR